jgi:DNA-binding SARP family transcriptional activator
MGLEFRLLGPLEAVVDGTPAPLGGPRQRALAAILLVHANEVVPVSRLIDELWPDDPLVTASNVLLEIR